MKAEFDRPEEPNLSQLHQEVQLLLGWQDWRDSPDKKGYNGLRADQQQDESWKISILWTDDGITTIVPDLKTIDYTKAQVGIVAHQPLPNTTPEEKLLGAGFTQNQIQAIEDLGIF